MLRELYIRNIALISELRLSFKEGFNVLSGETGAGKSIIVDSIGLISGDRGGRELISTGSETAYVEALFDMSEALIPYFEEKFGKLTPAVFRSRKTRWKEWAAGDDLPSPGMIWTAKILRRRCGRNARPEEP